MMFLKYRYRLGYEPLCREVADSIAWRGSAVSPSTRRRPIPTTLMKITSRCGERAVAGLNDALLDKAAENKVDQDRQGAGGHHRGRGRRLLPDGLGAVGQGRGQDGPPGRPAQGRRPGDPHQRPRPHRSVRRRAHAIGAWLRRRSDDAKEEAKAITGEMATIAVVAVADARQSPSMPAGACAARECRQRAGRRPRGRARAHGGPGRAGRRPDPGPPGGGVPDGSTRVVSLHDADARPIAKGRLGKPVEFGYKAQVVDNVDGVVLDHGVVVGNPADAPCWCRPSPASPPASARRPGR